MKKIRSIAVSCIFFFGIAIGLSFTGMATIMAANDGPECEQGEFDADCLFPTWQSDANPGQAEDAIIQGVIGSNQDGGFVMTYIPKIIDILLKFIAPIVVLTMIYAGIRFITAQGNDDELSKAKDFFIYAIVGVGLVIMSYSIMKVVYFLVAKG